MVNPTVEAGSYKNTILSFVANTQSMNGVKHFECKGEEPVFENKYQNVLV